MLRLSRAGATTDVNRVGSDSWIPMRDDPILGPYAVPPRAVAAAPQQFSRPVPTVPRRVIVEHEVNLDAVMRQHGAGHIGKPAGFWIRTCAYLIDGIVLALLQVVVSLAMVGIVGPNSMPGSVSASALRAAPHLTTFIYFVMFNCGSWQATPGKRLLGIYVRRADGHRMTIAQGFGRYMALILSMIPLASAS